MSLVALVQVSVRDWPGSSVAALSVRTEVTVAAEALGATARAATSATPAVTMTVADLAICNFMKRDYARCVRHQQAQRLPRQAGEPSSVPYSGILRACAT